MKIARKEQEAKNRGPLNLLITNTFDQLYLHSPKKETPGSTGMANVSYTDQKKVTPRFFKIQVEQARSFFFGGVYMLFIKDGPWNRGISAHF